MTAPHARPFSKHLNVKEIYANTYRDFEDLQGRLEDFIDFIEQYYNELRLHSALGYCSPEKFEKDLNGRVKSGQRWSGQNRPTDVARDSDVLPCRLHIRQA